MAKTVTEIQEMLVRKTEELNELFAKHKTDKIDTDGRPQYDMTATTIQEIKDRNTELATLESELEYAQVQDARLVNEQRTEHLKGIDRTAQRPPTGPLNQAGSPARINARTAAQYAGKSLGQIVTESNEYKFRNTSNKHFTFDLEDVDLKTLISIGAGFTPPNYRTDTVVDYPNRRLVVADVIPSDPTTLQVVKWMENTTFTNNAASVSEGGAKPESALAWTERSATVEKIATWIPVTEEQIDDVPAMMGLINRDIVLMLGLEEEVLLLTGNGVSPQMRGFLNAVNLQTQAKGGDDRQDAIYKAFTLVRYTGFGEPSAVIMHPTDWQNIRLLRTTDGLYIFGTPQENGAENLFGKTVVVTPAMSQGTALTGDFTMYSHISRRMGIRIDVANQHSTYFTSNLLVVRGEMRESLEIKRGSAFCQVTGL